MSSQLYIYYETEQGIPEYYELTCTTDVTVNKTNTVSSTPVESGYNITDNVFKNQVQISFRGLISDVKNLTLDYQYEPEIAIRDINNLSDSGGVFTLFVDDDLDAYNNCVFKSFSISKSSGQGKSWKASVDITQIDIVEQATSVTFPPQDAEVAKQAEEKSTQSDNNTETESVNYSVGVATGMNLTDLFFGTNTPSGG